MDQSSSPRVAAYGAVLLWSTSAAALSLTDPRIPGHVILAWVYTLAALSILVFIGARALIKRQSPALSLRPHASFRSIAQILAFCLFDFAHELAFLLGVRTNAPIKATLLNYLWPLWLALFTVPLKTLTARARTALFLPLLVAFAGVALISRGNQSEGPFAPLPIVFGLVSSLCAATYMAILMNLVQTYRIGVPVLITINLVLSTIGLWIIDPAANLHVLALPSLFPLLIYLALFTVVLPELLWSFFLGAQRGGANALSAFGIPLLSTLWLALVKRQPPGTATILGGAAILCALLLSTFLHTRAQPGSNVAKP